MLKTANLAIIIIIIIITIIIVAVLEIDTNQVVGCQLFVCQFCFNVDNKLKVYY